MLAVLSIARLETDVTADEVVIAFHGIWPTRRVRIADIVAHEARRYSLLDSGGWGVQWGLRDGKRVLIGSRSVGAARAFFTSRQSGRKARPRRITCGSLSTNPPAAR